MDVCVCVHSLGQRDQPQAGDCREFYNSHVDYVNYILDYDAWQHRTT